MNSLILHIGSHKTGSSSIQESLFGFEDDDFCYLKLPKANHSKEIGRLFGVSHPRKLVESDETLSLIRREIHNLGDRALIVSAEDISSLSRQSLENLFSFFKFYFQRVTIVGYVRSPGAYMTSAYQQVARNKDYAPPIAYRSYRRTFLKFDDIFGEQNVRLFKFDPARFPNRCVVKHFATTIGLVLPEDRIVRSNDSVCRLTIQLSFCYHQIYPNRPHVAHLLDPICRLIDGKGLTIAPSILQRLISENMDDLVWMEQRLGASLHEIFTDDSPEDFFHPEQLLLINPHSIEALRAITRERVTVDHDGSPMEFAHLAGALLEMVEAPSRTVLDEWASVCRDIALRIERTESLELSDALRLMQIAKVVRPRGPVINQKIVQWELALKSLDEIRAKY